MTLDPLPMCQDEITPQWLTRVLGHEVKELTPVLFRQSTSTVYVVEVAYGEADCPLPRRLCIKGGFDPRMLAIAPAMISTYRREAEFYHHIKPLVEDGMRLPRTYYCGTNPPEASGQGVVIMDDLQSQGYAFGDALVDWPVDRVRAGLGQLAVLHGRTWGRGVKEYPWLAGESVLSAVVFQLMAPELWPNVEINVEPLGAPKLADRERMTRVYRAAFRHQDPRYRCVIHADSHIENTTVGADGVPGFIDWQALGTGSCFQDVVYFVNSCLSVADRRRHELELLAYYLDQLHAQGGPRLAQADVWDEYRKNSMHGFGWCLIQPNMKSQDVTWAMVARMGQAIVDHDTIKLLEALEAQDPPAE